MSQWYKNAEGEIKSVWDLKNLRILPKNSPGGLGSRREHWWGCISIDENTSKKLPHFPANVAAALFKGTLMQIWKSTNIFVFIWK